MIFKCPFRVYIVSDLSLVKVSMIIIRECTTGSSLLIVTIVGQDLRIRLIGGSTNVDTPVKHEGFVSICHIMLVLFVNEETPIKMS